VLRFRVGTAAGAITLLLLAGTGVVNGRVSAAPVAAKQTTTTIRFTFSEKGHAPVGGVRELTRASGSGTLTLAETPQENAVYKSTSATGTIRFHAWRVVGGRVIDVVNLTMAVQSGMYRFTSGFQNVPLQTTVTKSDPNEKYTCPVGSTGGSGVLDGKVKSRPDSFSIGEFCGLPQLLYGGVSGARAAVVVKVTRGTP
jgi:hypothetical protein